MTKSDQLKEALVKLDGRPKRGHAAIDEMLAKQAARTLLEVIDICGPELLNSACMYRIDKVRDLLKREGYIAS